MMAREPRIIDLNPLGYRSDCFCPVCNTFPRGTVPADPPLQDTHLRCLTCGEVWEDHHDHTPYDNTGNWLEPAETPEQPVQVEAVVAKYDSTLQYVREMHARGRNGTMKQLGIDLLPMTDRAVPLHSYVLLSPINSRGISDAAWLQIPLESLTEFIAKLEAAQQVLLTEIEKLINPAENQT